MKPSRFSLPKTFLDASLTTRVCLSTAWVWQGNWFTEFLMFSRLNPELKSMWFKIGGHRWIISGHKIKSFSPLALKFSVAFSYYPYGLTTLRLSFCIAKFRFVKLSCSNKHRRRFSGWAKNWLNWSTGWTMRRVVSLAMWAK